MNPHIIPHTHTILQALEMLNALSGGVMTLFVTDDAGHMVGSLTDGDIRRGLLCGYQPSDNVQGVMHRNFSALTGPNVDVEQLRAIRARGVRLVPVLDNEGSILRIIDTSITQSALPISAILMAGGKGERLRPLTLSTPKPLLEVGGMPIIDHNIHALARVGVTNIFVTVNYLADMMEEHFARPVAGVNVTCIHEPKPLGTIGSAKLAPIPEQGATVVMNSDLLTDISLEEMYLSHISKHADITIAAIPYNVSVPYAILSTDGSNVTALEEKPSYAFYANAGIYMVNNELIHDLPDNTRTDATDLIEQTITNGGKVTYFPISGTWIDIGSPADYQHACELAAHRIGFNNEQTNS
ncbi:MAG: NTP transferase domain-containing protein [Paramuribaculum sp.]|nr:NTP transferase domain-containing protein [Paramuribaculum sp.]